MIATIIAVLTVTIIAVITIMQMVDCSDCVLTPGLVDLHTHLYQVMVTMVAMVAMVIMMAQLIFTPISTSTQRPWASTPPSACPAE